MEQLEVNIIKSFKKVRYEIDKLQHQILDLKQKVEDIDEVLLRKEKKSSGKKK